MKPIRACLLTLACLVPVAGMAQWQWIDKDGRKVFSDQAPPPDLPAKNILRAPSGVKGKSISMVPTEPASAASAATPPKPPAPQLSGKDKELEAKKKAAESAEADKKKAQEEELARMRADNCARAKRSKQAFDSGVRISRMNAKGEQEYLDDAQRAAEAKRLDGVIASDCKAAS
ncbi:DUF4124 domain-containing protein [Caenimonas aquaedulcis]|uniref:DUF4124 domain-containing protein n=1 Tax=Caenimonas aquaedulcis TaxID=2793270 RepID=A0A931MEU0_9BURK|nr:DUF4124 domain-containing protein [Caenimonas aquaedulcis]MBG9386957.1 DUF4124 domain-containing protein [Caenimonas aquaedulcis]